MPHTCRTQTHPHTDTQCTQKIIFLGEQDIFYFLQHESPMCVCEYKLLRTFSFGSSYITCSYVLSLLMTCLCFLLWLFHNLTSLWGLLLSSTFSLFILAFQLIIFIAKILCLGDPQLTSLTQITRLGPALYSHPPVWHLHLGALQVSHI